MKKCACFISGAYAYCCAKTTYSGAKFSVLDFAESWMAAGRGINQLLRRTLQNQSSVSTNIAELFDFMPTSSK
jgi:hypothetical protein